MPQSKTVCLFSLYQGRQNEAQIFSAYSISCGFKKRTIIAYVPIKSGGIFIKRAEEKDYILLLTHEKQSFFMHYYVLCGYCVGQSYMTELCMHSVRGGNRVQLLRSRKEVSPSCLYGILSSVM